MTRKPALILAVSLLVALYPAAARATLDTFGVITGPSATLAGAVSGRALDTNLGLGWSTDFIFDALTGFDLNADLAYRAASRAVQAQGDP